MTKSSQVLGGVLLVSGTTIGAAMLALPVSTGMIGFFPALALFFLFWLYMTYTAFLFLELNFKIDGNIDMISMARATIGKFGQSFCWVVYLFLLYSLTTAYIAGSGPIFQHAIQQATGWEIPRWAGPIPLVLIFGAFVYKGARSVDSVNRVLMGGLVVSFTLLITALFSSVDPSMLTRSDWSKLNFAIPVIATSFGFHIIIPSLTHYLDHRLSTLKAVIWIGSLIPLIVYIVWEMVALGIIPAEALTAGYSTGTSGAQVLAEILQESWIASVARFLSFFAIVTSFLGVSLSLRHFLADGLGIRTTRKGRLTLVALTFLPPLAITLVNPRAFLTALEYAGAYGVVTLLGLLPALMVWEARYKKKMKGDFLVPGGKPALVAAIAVSLIVMSVQLCNQLGIF